MANSDTTDVFVVLFVGTWSRPVRTSSSMGTSSRFYGVMSHFLLHFGGSRYLSRSAPHVGQSTVRNQRSEERQLHGRTEAASPPGGEPPP